ncbi:hypothetical protein EN836_26165 [Mesorhizobium sp. M1C.F.Ca.ET.193.01.1.1]|uniref:hypothetical protein n=2 Tax=Mesorhizobium TaxID=68287 RepID=UPI000FD548B6|nr:MULTISPECIES: hypothetical protein [unclassified Mesorhizobium]TGS93962.1 hypothetical protein EN820_46825 [bacterium M00.F.Ca.ET.177.01.1.1]TGQ51030.1 hypothetical protein EN853_26155 [Mesorhizobium sp. M1C.F.Ca.ET.210.01.1.1]TGQ66461.1 hypothetical protein EN855_026165 [Mesorhizobium sp. M1C.F.Ca.ET.212.01.1.1]TGR00857.1 hypothetical protein EN847_26155 [Mesorhizobium sp. M1C.F.Ca.ET.204.01.1.1]TGR21132.1 hypothetical protein EN839_26155 [Mesorhizobium sp. M1C.F.Ca.ET.196.01.1.1]
MANFGSLSNCIDAAGSVGSATAGQLGYYDTSGNAILGKSLTDVLDAAVGSGRGSILYRGSGGWVSLAPGTAGYVLQSGGPSGDPSWVPGGGSGGIGTIVGAGVSSTGPVVALPAPVVSRPALSSLTWLNQASATATDNANGPLVLKTTQNTSASSNLNALTKSVAGGDWTVTIQYAQGNHTSGSNTDIFGLIVRSSFNNRIYVCGLNGSSAIAIWSYSTATAWNSSVASKTILPNYSNVWVRASYTSATTTLTFFYSIDGYTWDQVYTTASPYTGAPTDYGITVGSAGNSTGAILSLNYMAESSP